MISESIDPKKSIERAQRRRERTNKWKLYSASNSVAWGNRVERLSLIRNGLPYEFIESISVKANLPVKQVLDYFGIAQTTYNKKRRDNNLMSRRDSEIVLVLSEALDFGLEVFNQEKEKFHRWLKKPNLSLGNVCPESLFDSLTGIQEVSNALNRLEYGNLA